MYIKIAERLLPFSHLPGTQCVLPGTSYLFEIFPTRIRVYEGAQFPLKFLTEIVLNIEGPLQEFTVQSDLEKGVIRVWGQTPFGLLRYHLHGYFNQTGFQIYLYKAPKTSLNFIFQKENCQLSVGKSYSFLMPTATIASPLFVVDKIERLSLGNHKSQDWALVQRRQDFTEIMPIWFRLGQMIPQFKYDSHFSTGTLLLLKKCKEQLKENQPEKTLKFWSHLFLCAFNSLLSPTFQDVNFQGIIPFEENFSSSYSPFILLTEGAKIIRAFFLQEVAHKLKLLPALPPEFHCGRFLDLKVQGGNFSMEWTKKKIRQCEFKVGNENINVELEFRHATSFRCRKNGKGSGEKIAKGQILSLEKNSHYFFDNFI